MLNNIAPQPNRHRLARISVKKLAKLQEKARAHDQYLAATKRMRERQAQVMLSMEDDSLMVPLPSRGWHAGWLACLREFSEAVKDAIT